MATFNPSYRMLTAFRGLENPDFAGFREPLSALAQSVTDQLFRPGGAVEGATRGALGRSVQSGFGPRSGGFDAARLNILQGASDTVGNTVGQAAVQLAPLALQQRESQFGAASTLEGLRLSEEQLAQNQRLIDAHLQQQKCGIGDRLGAGLMGGLSGALGASANLGGAGAAAATGGLSTLAGGILGGLGGIFGGC